jgi:hypothetical protein
MWLHILNSVSKVQFNLCSSIPNETLLKALKNRNMNSRKNALKTESDKTLP